MSEKFFLKLKIDHLWREWHPKRGQYAGKTKYVCIAITPDHDMWKGQPAILAGFKKNGQLHMHLASMTLHQIFTNTTTLVDKELINQLEEKFLEYQKMWEERRLVNTVKSLLMA